MSSIFSDPPFRRGSTLLSGDLKEAGTGNDLPGGEIVGSVKAFQDVNPYTGVRYSNRLVYCIAVRWKGTDNTAASDIAGDVYAVDLAHENGKPFATITSAATNSNVSDARHYGVVDEYLTGTVRQNDVLWLVVKGPTSIQAANTSAIASGAKIEVTGTAGRVQTASTGVVIGTQIAGASVTPAAAGELVRVNVTSEVV